MGRLDSKACRSKKMKTNDILSLPKGIGYPKHRYFMRITRQEIEDQIIEDEFERKTLIKTIMIHVGKMLTEDLRLLHSQLINQEKPTAEDIMEDCNSPQA